MADYPQPGPPGAASNGPNMNGSGDVNFPPPQPMPSSNEAAKTLWMGEMEGWMDENFIKNVCQTLLGEVVQVKVIRDRNSGNAGYCFIEFNTPEAAQKALNLNGQAVPNSTRVFKLNWASGGGLVDRRDDRGPEYSIFVGDLGPEVNEFVLVSLFQSRFPSCKSAKIMTDAMTGQSRGYGFVRFAEESDQQRALVEMQGVYCGNRPMRISTATPKTRSHQYGHGHNGQQMVPPVSGPPGPVGWGMPQFYNQPPFNPMQPMNQFTDPNNTTVFVGGLSGYVTEDELRSFFQGFGDITYVKIPLERAAASSNSSIAMPLRWLLIKCRATRLAIRGSACPGVVRRTTLESVPRIALPRRRLTSSARPWLLIRAVLALMRPSILATPNRELPLEQCR
ncbi:hypothetical protein B0T17DRAFT_638707 [Bombardia bombarda]|uniref:RRM domain-containing protein n=1 Tax=Bombardia bombarda TaxID=252184 RepID=A0AA40C483_9PEZI|nr:hypothetical protein B0T17DRAFT_638707 [Bombardia bombarda]